LSVTSCPSYLPACSIVIVVMVKLFAYVPNEQFSREV